MARLRSTPYQRGRAFEGRVRSAIVARGWIVVRAAGSKGIVDLVAWRPDIAPEMMAAAFALIQCRSNGSISPASRARLLSVAPKWLRKVYVASTDGRRLIFRSARTWRGGLKYPIEGVF